uniref:Phosphotyrosine protein phosphatase I domain-containing protein n=1 Tax=Tetraselmis sp. GSL018 TaxID=582737 RepID=A0A061S3M4_9CHLO|mmetsp:Transcript_17147/g.40922  ORF Transcript_17147/g.40922 Transcript_17147/m.40922 type:complete len:305 (-) Transcript_17147:527-1441(-)
MLRTGISVPSGVGQVEPTPRPRSSVSPQATIFPLNGDSSRRRSLPDAARRIRSPNESSPVPLWHSFQTQTAQFQNKRRELDLPDIGWQRNNTLRILLVDRSDTVRARMAAGLLELILDWNEFGKLVLQERCGVEVAHSDYLPVSTTFGLISQAQNLKVPAKHFIRRTQRFDSSMLQRCDLLVAMDSWVHQYLQDAIDSEFGLEWSPEKQTILGKISLISDFFGWCSDDEVSAQGPAAVLPGWLSHHLGTNLMLVRRSADIMRPDLVSPQGMDEWYDMSTALLLGCASLVQYLMDAFTASAPSDV